MATWILVTLWCLWSLWTALEVISLIATCKYNNDRRLYATWRPEAYYGPIAKTTSYLYVILTVAWLCYNFV